ncbi:MAG: putative oxidoreductase [Solirubrobacterales bacterium]|jgi:NAD(P)-dependent dehydrogenase (short-subunit alcohol dehydrogenase family)|nr:putative oxidoreductase [Solirubrobacterales bacterium]
MGERATDDVRTYVITGAAGGIGGAAAERLLRTGANVVAVDISQRRLDEFAERTADHPGALLTARADVTVEAGAREVIDKTLERFETFHGLANVAGGIPKINESSYDMLLKDISHDFFTRTFQLNVDTAFLMTKAAEDHLIERDYGKVVNVASLAAWGNRHELGNAAYNSAKAAVVGLTRTLSMLLGKHGIRVNAIAPGLILSPRVQGFVEQGYHDRHLASTALGRLATLEEAGATIAFLLEPPSDGITGELIRVAAGVR